MSKELREFQNAIKSDPVEMAQEIAQLRSDLEVALEERQQALDVMDLWSEQKEALRKERDQLRADLEAAREEIEEWKIRAAGLCDDCSVVEQKEKLRADLEISDNVIATLKAELEEATKDRDYFKELFDECEVCQKVKELEAENARLKEQLKEYEK